MSLRRITIFIVLLLLAASLSAYAGQDFLPFTGAASSDGVNVRADSTVSSPVVCLLTKGQLIEVAGGSYEWYRIKLPKGAPAYLRADLVSCIDNPPANIVTHKIDSTQAAGNAQLQGCCRNAKVIEPRVNVRSGPNESSWIIAKAQANDVINIVEAAHGWYKITPPDNSYGWVHKKFIAKANAEASQKPAPSTAALQVEQICVSGIIKPYGKVLWRNANHKIVTDDFKTYLLKGKKSVLDTLNHRKVSVTGRLSSVPPGSKYPVIEVELIQDLSSPS